MILVALHQLFQRLGDALDYGFTAARLWVLDRLTGPMDDDGPEEQNRDDDDTSSDRNR